MIARPFKVLFCIVLLGAGLSACQPYVFDPNEFNRERKEFGRDLKDRTEVNICYFTRHTTPQDILAMAEAECAKFGKTAHYRHSELGQCPMATPTMAHFTCDPR